VKRSIDERVKKILSKLFVLWAIFALIQLSGCAATQENQREDRAVNEKTVDEKAPTVEERLGIEVVGIRESAAGFMLDFRYRVKDPEKALPVLSAQMKPYIIDQNSGNKLSVPTYPKVGSLRQRTREPEVDRVYFIVFANPGRLVKAGNKVTVILGDVKVEDLVVE
jgi:hypothetical protein